MPQLRPLSRCAPPYRSRIAAALLTRALVFRMREQLRKQQFMTLLRGVDELGRALEEDGPAPASTASAAPMQVD